MAEKKRTQHEAEWDVEMLRAIARRLNAPFDLVFDAYRQEMEYRIKQAEARAETAHNLLAIMQSYRDSLIRRHDQYEESEVAPDGEDKARATN